MKKWMIAVLSATLSLSAMAQQEELQELPGYVEFGELTSVYGEPKVMINIGGSLLKFMSAATKKRSGSLSTFARPARGAHQRLFDRRPNGTRAGTIDEGQKYVTGPGLGTHRPS